jgi:hypothetical protein
MRGQFVAGHRGGKLGVGRAQHRCQGRYSGAVTNSGNPPSTSMNAQPKRRSPSGGHHARSILVMIRNGAAWPLAWSIVPARWRSSSGQWNSHVPVAPEWPTRVTG